MADLRKFKGTGQFSTALSLAPDGSPLLLRDTETWDVYAIRLGRIVIGMTVPVT